MPPFRPISKYFGGKAKLAPKIICHFPPHRLYIEPFSGMANVLLQKDPADHELLVDLNPEIVNLLLVIRDHTEEFVGHLNRINYCKDTLDRVLTASKQPVDMTKPMREAIITYCKLKMSYSGTTTNTGYSYAGQKSWHHDHLFPIAQRLQKVNICCDNSLNVIQKYKHRSDVLIYLDPPYLQSTINSRGKYDCNFAKVDHINLLTVIQDAKCKIVLSGYESELYNQYLPTWQKIQFPARTNGADKIETLYINF